MATVAQQLATLYVLEQNGPVEPSNLLGPVRQSAGKFGDGLFIEEGTTNLVTNPSFEVDTTGWATTNGATFVSSAARAYLGSKSGRLTATATGTSTAQFTLTITSGVAYTMQARVFNPTVGSTGVNIFGTSGLTVSGPTVTTVGSWVYLTATVTSTSTTGIIGVAMLGAAIGQFIDIDAVQLEQKGYATSYCEGSLATVWNSPGNLLSAAAQSFEDGSLGTWLGAGSAAGSITNSSASAYVGTKSLIVTSTGAGGFGAELRTIPNLIAVTPGKTYSGSAWVKTSAALNVYVALVYYDSAGSYITLAGPTVAAPAGTFVRSGGTGVAPANAAYAGIQVIATATATAQTIAIDGARLDEGSATNAYRWTGAENASTSTRTASVLAGAVSFPGRNVSLGAIGRMGSAAITYRVLAQMDDGTSSNYLNVYATSGAVTATKAVGGVVVSATVSVSVPAGSLLVAWATHDGTSLVVYASVDGGAVVSSSTATATTLPALTRVNIGNDSAAGSQPNGVVEQVLVYSSAVSLAEVTALANSTGETRFHDDPRIVFAAAAGLSRGTVRSVTAAGSGYYRVARSLSAFVEPITPNGASPDDDTATSKASVPAGSGVGQGQFVSMSPSAAASTVKQVQRASSPGGVLDELYLAAYS